MPITCFDCKKTVDTGYPITRKGQYINLCSDCFLFDCKKKYLSKKGIVQTKVNDQEILKEIKKDIPIIGLDGVIKRKVIIDD